MTQVLIVDDEQGIRNLLSEILSDEGYAVCTAEDAMHAREVVRSTKIDLILLDIWMPDTDGVSLLKEWVATKAINCPVVMMSGHGTIETAMEATRFGAMDFLEKPIGMKRLLQTCARVLEDWSSQGKDNFDALLTGKVPELNQQRSTHPVPFDGCLLLEEGTPTRREGDTVVSGRLPVIAVPALGIVLDFNKGFREAREDFERAYLTRTLYKQAGSMTDLSKHSKLERTHLYRKFKTLGIETNDYTREDLNESDLPIFGLPEGSDLSAKS